MASYLMLFRGGDIAARGWSPEETGAYYQSWEDWGQQLRDTGIWIAGHPLQDEGRVLGPEPSVVTDGPFAETKEVLGGYILFEAADMDEAERVARGCPIFHVSGRVEVRPVVERGLCSAASDAESLRASL